MATPTKKAAAKKATVPAKKVTTNSKPAAPKKAATKPQAHVPHIVLVAGKTGEIVRIPLSGDVLDAVLGAVARQAAVVTPTATDGQVPAPTASITFKDNGTQKINRSSTLIGRIADLKDQLLTTAWNVNNLIGISNRFFGENGGVVETPSVNSDDTNLIGQLDELLKHLRVYNAATAETIERLDSFI